MKLLIYDWNSITRYDVYTSIMQQKIEYDLFCSSYSPRNIEEKELFEKELKKAVENKSYDAIFSINYFEELAKLANRKDILYISWTYDSPALSGARSTVNLNTNRIFCFDSSEYFQEKKNGVENIYYLPLATNISRLNKIKISPIQKLKYYTDISFVGQLYHSYIDEIYPLFDEYSAGYISGIVNTQLNIYGTNIVQELINPDVLNLLTNDKVKKALINNLKKGFYPDLKDINHATFAGFLLKTVTNKERIIILKLLARYFKVKLYSYDSIEIENVEKEGTVDYMTEMPLVFKCSKINLNTTLKLIKTGIPQRVIDIMGCGGLVLTNYQKDLDEFFEDNRDILIYRSVEEVLDKCRYYLSNDDKAQIIRENGYKIVHDIFSYEYQLNKIWKICDLKK